MTGTKCDYHGQSPQPFHYSDKDYCWECNEKMLKALDALERIRELHKPFGDNNEWCVHCEIGQNSGYDWADYPCDTIKALEGEK